MRRWAWGLIGVSLVGLLGGWMLFRRFHEEKIILGWASNRTATHQNKMIRGVIIPHHLLAQGLIEEGLALAAKQGYERIILITPLHQGQGQRGGITTSAEWMKARGHNCGEDNWCESVKTLPGVQDKEELINNEHAVGGILPFMERFFPQVPVAVLAMSNFTDKDEVEMIATQLQQYITDGTLVVAAVDFSHYLTASEASANDEVTVELMERRDYAMLLNMGDDYLDGSVALYLFFETLASGGVNDFKLIKRGNSGEMLGDRVSASTGYVVGLVY